jgi:hypothetical protein
LTGRAEAAAGDAGGDKHQASAIAKPSGTFTEPDERRVSIRPERMLEVLVGLMDQVAAHTGWGIVDEHVDAPEGFFSEGEELRDGAGLGDIALTENSAMTCALDLVYDRGARIGSGATVHHHLHAISGQPAGDRTADALRAAGDDRHLGELAQCFEPF